jgi:hypothetical protein
MKILVLSALYALCCSAALAWDNPCYTGMLLNKVLPKMAESMVTLEPGRVVTVEENVFLYDLGKEKVIIRAKAYGVREFLARLKKGKCEKGELVTLVPKEQSTGNRVFDAVAPGL